MCDESLGKVLDMFDAFNLWEDTMLIVNTDHGYLLGEHGFWAKNYMPLYEEISHIPLFMWNPKVKQSAGKCDMLVQTIDIPVTILNFFNIPIPKDMLGKDLTQAVSGKKLHDGVLFGLHGKHVCCTDGKYVYMRAPSKGTCAYQYTLMPTHMASFFTPDSIKTMQRREPFSFTKEMPVMKMKADYQDNEYFDDMLFDLEADPHQLSPIQCDTIKERMISLIKKLMQENDAPAELYERFSL